MRVKTLPDLSNLTTAEVDLSSNKTAITLDDIPVMSAFIAPHMKNAVYIKGPPTHDGRHYVMRVSGSDLGGIGTWGYEAGYVEIVPLKMTIKIERT